MLVIVGKASPNEQRGDIEYYLDEFREKLSDKGRFVYAWSFNPDGAAIEKILETLDRGGPVFLYLPEAGGYSKLRMRVDDFYLHRGNDGAPCPDEWQNFCIEGLKHDEDGRERRDFGPRRPIHLWFLISSIEELPQPVKLLGSFNPVFPNKYREWRQNFFAFLSD